MFTSPIAVAARGTLRASPSMTSETSLPRASPSVSRRSAGRAFFAGEVTRSIKFEPKYALAARTWTTCSSAPVPHQIPGKVELVKGVNDLPKVVISHPSGSKAEIYLQGANVVSWKIGLLEMLLLSETAVFETGKPIRGGVPICWPQFGPGSLPQHGLVRQAEWYVKGSREKKDGTLLVTFGLEDSEETRAVWPYKFALEYTVSLTGAELGCELKVMNTGDKPFEFTGGLHSYVRCSDPATVQFRGLKNLTFIDKVAGGESKEMDEPVQLTGATDRVYLKAPNEIRMLDRNAKRAVVSRKYGFSDAVIWNPWEGPVEWSEFVCLEAVQAGAPVTVEAGGEWFGWQNLVFSKLM
eukprot:tig00000217_g19152.t1